MALSDKKRKKSFFINKVKKKSDLKIFFCGKISTAPHILLDIIVLPTLFHITYNLFRKMYVFGKFPPWNVVTVSKILKQVISHWKNRPKTSEVTELAIRRHVSGERLQTSFNLRPLNFQYFSILYVYLMCTTDVTVFYDAY